MNFERPTESKEASVTGSSSEFKIVPRVTISDNTSEVFCVKFSPDGKFLTAGCGDGAIRVFNTQTGMLTYNIQGGSSIALPTTAIRFRPVTASSRTKNVFLAANAAGAVQHWHMTSGKCLHTLEDEENQVYALDYDTEGTRFVTAGKDKCIRVYDEATKSLIVKMSGGTGYTIKTAPGHSNRIFSVKYTSDNNIVISGGWDNTVQIWDVRTNAAVRSIYGPHICGDALDLVKGEILTGSWRPEDQLEIWDFGTGERITSIPFSTQFSAHGSQSCMLYAAQFSKESQGNFILAGGSGANEARVFDHANDNALVGTLTGLSRGIFTVDFSEGDFKKFAVAGGDATIRIMEIVGKEQS
jgi:COMPASS component SWD3